MKSKNTHLSRICGLLFSKASVFALLAVALVLSPMAAYGATVTLAWDANTEPDLAGYKIHYGTASGVYSHTIDVGNVTEHILTELDDGVTYYLAATAYDVDDNESGYSDELVHTTDAPNHNPDTPSVPNSPSNGYTQTSYTFSTSASDTDGDALEFRFDWGDDSTSDWGAASQNHSWSSIGIFCVKAQARDSQGAVSGWSDCRSITIAEDTHVITASAGANGSISPSGSLTVSDGASRTFTIRADANHHVQNVLVDGVSVGSITSYTFTAVTENHTIAASFSADNLSPAASAGPDQTVNEGTVVNLRGANSTDSDGSITAYVWSQISGPPVHLSNSGQVEASFISPNVDVSGDTLVFELIVTDNEGLQDTDRCTVFVTREPIADSDGDGVPDDQDDFPYNGDEYLDTDGDGEGNNADTDDDNDGMPDTWELLYGLDPLIDDAADDPDGDEISNINEFNLGSEPNFNENNFAPDAPQLLAPNDNETVGLAPFLETAEFYDANIGDVHGESQWKIIRVDDAFCVFDVTTSSSLTQLKVPKLILEQDTLYSWQVKFLDNQGTASSWSEIRYFTTEFIEEDSDGNGVLDHQEVDMTIDLDKNGTPDRNQEDIKCITTGTGEFKLGISVGEDENADSIISLQSESPDDAESLISDQNGPAFIAFGLIHFKLLVDQPGAEILATIYLSQAAYDDGIWYKYDPVNDEWFDYSEFVEISNDRKTVYLTLRDGGFGDADGIENGIIVDPLALRTATDHSSGGDFILDNVAENLDPTGACFISAAGSQPKDFSKVIPRRELSLVFILMVLALIGKVISSSRKQYRRPGRGISLMEGWRNSQG